MKSEINEKLEQHIITNHSDKNLYVADYKHFESHYGVKKYEGKVVILNSYQDDWKSVYLSNPNQIEICFDGFEDNALPSEVVGTQNSQCECVLFPDIYNDNSWILFIDTKYSSSFENAFRKENNYPHSMINQIIETVKYFRDKGIIADNKRVQAIVSFPNLAEEFNSYFFQGKEIEILKEHKILIRATNSALIKSEKRITLKSV